MLLLQPAQWLGILMVGLRLINMQLSVLAARRPADLRLTHLRHVYAHCDNFLIVLEVVNITAGLGRMGRKSTFVMWIGKRMVHLEKQGRLILEAILPKSKNILEVGKLLWLDARRNQQPRTIRIIQPYLVSSDDTDDDEPPPLEFDDPTALPQ